MGSAGSKRRQSARLFGPRPRRKQARNAEIVTHTPIYGALKFYENLRFPAYQKRRVRLPPSWTGSTAWWCWCSSWWRHHKNYLFHQLCVNSSLEASRKLSVSAMLLGKLHSVSTDKQKNFLGLASERTVFPVAWTEVCRSLSAAKVLLVTPWKVFVCFS